MSTDQLKMHRPYILVHVFSVQVQADMRKKPIKVIFWEYIHDVFSLGTSSMG